MADLGKWGIGLFMLAAGGCTDPFISSEAGMGDLIGWSVSDARMPESGADMGAAAPVCRVLPAEVVPAKRGYLSKLVAGFGVYLFLSNGSRVSAGTEDATLDWQILAPDGQPMSPVRSAPTAGQEIEVGPSILLPDGSFLAYASHWLERAFMGVHYRIGPRGELLEAEPDLRVNEYASDGTRVIALLHETHASDRWVGPWEQTYRLLVRKSGVLTPWWTNGLDGFTYLEIRGLATHMDTAVWGTMEVKGETERLVLNVVEGQDWRRIPIASGTLTTSYRPMRSYFLPDARAVFVYREMAYAGFSGTSHAAISNQPSIDRIERTLTWTDHVRDLILVQDRFVVLRHPIVERPDATLDLDWYDMNGQRTRHQTLGGGWAIRRADKPLLACTDQDHCLVGWIISSNDRLTSTFHFRGVAVNCP